MRVLRFTPSQASEYLAQDLRWAWEASPRLRGLPDPLIHPAPWQAIMSDDALWSRALKEFEASYSRLKPREVAPVFYDSTSSPPPESAPFCCSLCPATRVRCCTSDAGLRSHMHRTHGVQNSVRQYVSSSHCPVCKRECGSRPAAIDHLAYRAKACRLALSGLPRLSARKLWKLDEQDREAAKLCGWTVLRGQAIGTG